MASRGQAVSCRYAIRSVVQVFSTAPQRQHIKAENPWPWSRFHPLGALSHPAGSGTHFVHEFNAGDSVFF
jgi:hypothetical protein